LCLSSAPAVHQVTDAVQALADRCPSPKSVNLMCCSKVTDAGVQALAERCPSPESVNLMCGFKVTDAGVQALATIARASSR